MAHTDPRTPTSATTGAGTNGAQPTHATEAERALLGALLTGSHQALTTILPELDPTELTPRHGHTLAAIRTLHDHGHTVDLPSTAAQLEADGLLPNAGGHKYLADLYLQATSTAPEYLHYHLRHVHAATRRRRTIATLAEALNHTRDGADPTPWLDQLDELRASAERAPSSWEEINLATLEESPDAPALLHRHDDQPILYPGKVHLVFGEPEACKGWLALVACAEQINAGHHVIYVDFEDSPAAIKERLRALLVPLDDIHQRFHYLRPDQPYDQAAAQALDQLLALEPPLVVIDGVTEAMMIHDLDLGDNTEVARFFDQLPKRIARTGAAVVLIDHVVKDREGRGRWAIGAQHKLAAVDGAAFMLAVLSPFGRDRRGKVKVTVQKDRPGHVRALCEDGHRVIEMRLESHPDGGVAVDLAIPLSTDVSGPTFYMEKVSKVIEEHGPISKRSLRGLIKGANDVKEAALELLITRGYVEVEKHGQSHLHRSVRPFRESDTPADDDPNQRLDIDEPEPF